MLGLVREVAPDWLNPIGVLVAPADRARFPVCCTLPPNDPGTIALSVAVLSGIALFAGFLPARRASRIDPMVVLRQD